MGGRVGGQCSAVLVSYPLSPTIVPFSFLRFVVTRTTGTMHNQRVGLEGEDLIDDYKLQYRLGLIPDMLRSVLAPIVGAVMGARLSRMLVTLRSAMSAKEYWKTLADRTKYKQRFENVYRKHQLDCIVTPGTGLPAHAHGKFGQVTLAVMYMSLYNVLDWSAGSVPITVVNATENGVYEGSRFNDTYDAKGKEQMQDSLGLPIGVQIAAPSGKEEVVLRVMKELEQVVQFRQKHEPKGLGAALLSRM